MVRNWFPEEIMAVENSVAREFVGDAFDCYGSVELHYPSIGCGHFDHFIFFSSASKQAIPHNWIASETKHVNLGVKSLEGNKKEREGKENHFNIYSALSLRVGFLLDLELSS